MKSMQSTINKIIEDYENMQDYFVPVIKMDSLFEEEKKPHLYFPTTTDVFKPEPEILTFHPNALNQVSAKLGIPGQFMRTLHDGEDWEKNLFCRTINDFFHFSPRNEDKFLIRSNKGVAKAILSDSYDRYNSLNVLSTFLTEMKKHNFVGNNVYYDGITYFLEMTNKQIPIEINGQNHWLTVQYRNSDFGQSALDIRLMLTKQVCSNGMVLNSIMRSVHKGKKIQQGKDFKLSDKTLNLESELKQQIIADVIPQIVAEDNIIRIKNAFDEANQIDIPVDTVVEKLPSVNATKKDIENIKGILMSNDESTGTTDGGNVLRVVNAISFLANDFTEEEAEPANKYKEMSGKLLSKYVKF